MIYEVAKVMRHFIFEELKMAENDDNLMAKYGITYEQKTVYCYRTHKYDKLEDAIKYAEVEELRENEAVLQSSN